MLVRPDSDLAELDHAGAMLQREMAFREEAIVQLSGLLAIEHERDLAPLDRDLVGIPLPTGLGHRIDFGEVHNAAGPVGWILALVEDIGLVAVAVGDRCGILATQEDAAVGVIAGPELNVDDEILVLFC